MASTSATDGISVFNSLKPGPAVPFVPKKDGSVSWYSCGPTVYDLSHMGHARNYVSTDIIRRILLFYFKLDVNFVMNITDVDDKIIVKARRKRLFDLEMEKPYSFEERRTLVTSAFLAYAQSNLPLLVDAHADQLDGSNYSARRYAAYGGVLGGGTLTGEGKPGDAEAKTRMHLANMDAAARALQADPASIFGAEEVLLPYLDALYKETIDTSDQTMFTDLTQTMEQLFFDDMDALNVLRPDAITRVTEYVPRIVSFIEGIISKGFAYEANASVYFDIDAFEKAGNVYARLRPESKNDKALQEEGEGSLSKSLAGKRRPGDFALWKKSKPGEPFWPSPWGDGRPGWHIECSVMASDKLGDQMDIHSGGIDLAFPHHDNELAQSEAYFYRGEGHGGEHHWVRHFFHMGHLSIAGSKMSKSLKNFQTIQDALASTYTARSMRIVFLLSRWNEGVEISPDMRKQASSWETLLDNFFTNVKARAGEIAAAKMQQMTLSDAATAGAGGDGDAALAPAHADDSLAADFARAREELDAALRNSFDTPAAMQVILRLVRSANVYMSDPKANLSVMEDVASFVTRIAGIFGLDPSAQPPYTSSKPGWGPPNPASKTAAAAAAAAKVDPRSAVQPYSGAYAKVKGDVAALALKTEAGLNALLAGQDPYTEFIALLAKLAPGDALQTDELEQLALPFLRSVSALRDELRRVTGNADSQPKKAAILSLSDRIRDYDLAELGVQLDDQPDGRPSLIKFVAAAKLIAARDEKAAVAAAKAAAKAEAAAARAKAEEEKWAKAKVPPQALFVHDTATFGAFDADGLPTTLADGSDVPKTQQKRLKKEWERQKKLHEQYIEKFGA